MEIKKRLRINSAEEVNAVLINDEGEEYPVFLESLHNTVIFPTLMSSGYVLTALPYGFVKDGVALNQLPEETYTVDNINLEMMYNSIGVKLSYDELKSHISEKEAVGLPLPETNYTIFTREDLLKYLEATDKANLEDDFMPLNYFVAPAARFSIEEYRDIDNVKYIHLINKRREMSLSKFHKLVAALQKINLCVNPTPMDVLDAYFAWGLDGLDMTIIHKQRETRPFRLMANRNVNAVMTRRTFGLVDGSRNLLVPKNERNVDWKPAYAKDSLDVYVSGMQMNATRIMEYMSTATQDVTTLEGSRCNIRYSDETLLFQLQTYPTIKVMSPTALGSYIELRLALPTNKEELYTHCLIEALSRMIYEQRKPDVRISSFDALTISGCNANTALRYIVDNCNMSKQRKLETEDSAPVIFDFDIENYLKGKTVAENTKAFLDDVIDGVFNIDMIEVGKQQEAAVNLSTVFNEIYAIHHTLGIPLVDIYEKFRMVNDSVNTVTFGDENLYYTMDVSPLRFAERGYKADVQKYDLSNAQDCTFFTYVLQVAKELGNENARRHVGMEFLMVNRTKKPVQNIINMLVDKYEDKITTNVSDVNKQMVAKKFTYMFALSRFFEIALKGTITYPTMVGGEVEPAAPSLIVECKNYCERKIESITAYCDFTAQFNGTNNVKFNAYCTNAYITPTYVIPRSNVTIHEAPFNALWYDWQNGNPEVWSQLVNLGVIKPDHVAWDSRYFEEQFVKRDIFELDSMDSLLYYYDYANKELANYPANKVFVAVNHPNNYLFPGLCSEDPYEDMEELTVPRDGLPVARLGLTREITLDDYKDKLFPTTVIEKADSYIRPYKGLNADAIVAVKNIFDKMPADDKREIVVLARSQSVYVPDTDQTMSFSRITELDQNIYPVVHVYDRQYLLRAADGKLWEVRI